MTFKKDQFLWDKLEEMFVQVICADVDTFVVAPVYDRREGISTVYQGLTAYAQSDGVFEFFEPHTREQVNTWFDELYEEDCGCEEE